MIKHHQTCNADHRDARLPRSFTVIELYPLECSIQCDDCGAQVVAKTSDLNFFSFGFSQTHAFENRTLDKDTNVLLVGDAGRAREMMFVWFGPKWSMHYDFKNYSPKYFPKGIVVVRQC